MICFNYFKPQRSQRKNYRRKPGVLCVLYGEKMTNWPTKTLGHIKMMYDE